MASLNGKPVYEFRRYYAQIDDKSALRNIWDYYERDTEVFVECKLSDIKDKIKSVRGSVNPGQTLYFGKTSKFPRFKLSGSDFKRCIKPEKADVFIIGEFEGRERQYDYFFEDEIGYYLINQDSLDNIRTRNPLVSARFKANPLKYVKENLIYGSEIISEKTNVTFSRFSQADSIDVINIMNGTYKTVITDKELDKVINNTFDVVTEDDLKSITDLLDSPDQSSQGIGLKMLGALNINDIPLTIRTLLGFRRYLANCPEWKSVGVRNTLESIQWDDFGSFDYIRPIIEPRWKKQTYGEHDLALCKFVYIDIVKKQMEDNIKRIEASGVLNTFGIKINYDIS